jgi:hypothetical protein
VGAAAQDAWQAASMVDTRAVILLERHARLLLLLHAVGAGVLLGAATHHLWACRRYLRGDFGAARSERRYAQVVAAAYLATFAIGLLEYPAYRVRVRAEYFDAPEAVGAEVALRSEAARRLGSLPVVAAGPGGLSWVARLFDVKEHLSALGAAAALALWVLSRLGHPVARPRLSLPYVGLSLLVCTSAWTAALVGVLTASYRAVGAVT